MLALGLATGCAQEIVTLAGDARPTAVDAGHPDAKPSDAGASDAEPSDAEPGEVGPRDTGAMDTGPDAGDAGVEPALELERVAAPLGVAAPMQALTSYQGAAWLGDELGRVWRREVGGWARQLELPLTPPVVSLAPSSRHVLVLTAHSLNRWDGTTLRISALGAGELDHLVAAEASGDDGFALAQIGGQGHVLRFDRLGLTDDVPQPPDLPPLHALLRVGDQVFVGGDQGLILRLDTRVTTPVPTPEAVDWGAVGGEPPSILGFAPLEDGLYACGSRGVVLARDVGTATWRVVARAADGDVLHALVPHQGRLVAFGEAATGASVWRLRGDALETLAVPEDWRFRTATRDDERIWAVGRVVGGASLVVRSR